MLLAGWISAYVAATPGVMGGLDAVGLLAGDLAKVLRVLQQGTASPEHAALVQKLAPAGT